jgi:hypothetical protein
MLTIVPMAPTSADTARIRVTGTISDRAGYPLAGVNVLVVRADHEDSDVESTTTDGAGRFVTPRIPVDAAMEYKLVVTDRTGRHQTAYSRDFAATPANRTRNVRMAIAGIIRGKVTTKDGDIVRPARHVLVTANNSISVGTSSLGAFSLGGLPTGTYTLLFEDYDEDGTRPGTHFASICYDNIPRPVGNCADGTKVRVTAGKVTTINPQVLDDPIEP